MSTAVVIVLENRQPAKTIAWLIVIWLLPIIGLIFFYFFGQNVRREHHFRRRAYDCITQRMLDVCYEPSVREFPKRFAPLIEGLERNHLSVITGNNATELLPSGRQFLQALLRAIYAAKNHIHIETYIIEADAVGQLVADALADKAREGVEVRLLYDDVGCWRVPETFFHRLEKAGVRCAAFEPVRFPSLTRKVNYRNHRKVCIIDGHTGFIGGMNLALRYAPLRYADWLDMQLQLKGESVCALQRIFLSDWFFVTEELKTEQSYFPSSTETFGRQLTQIVFSTPFAQYSEIAYSLSWLIQNARNYIYIQSPYFVPTESFLQALQTAALVGVDVRIMLPARPDALFLRWVNESFFQDVLISGVRIFLYKGGFLHAKVLVADDEFSSVGSANMDFRSFENNFEANAYVYNQQTATDLRQLFLTVQEDCEEVSYDHWMQRPLWKRLLESHARILSPLM
jgi:cardiolipin synthetase